MTTKKEADALYFDHACVLGLWRSIDLGRYVICGQCGVFQRTSRGWKRFNGLTHRITFGRIGSARAVRRG